MHRRIDVALRQIRQDVDLHLNKSVITEACKRCDIKIIYEGIENEKQSAFVNARGALYAQGFHYLLPMPLNALVLPFG